MWQVLLTSEWSIEAHTVKKKLNFSSIQLEVNKGQGLIINNPKKRNMFLVQLVLPDSLSISNIYVVDRITERGRVCCEELCISRIKLMLSIIRDQHGSSHHTEAEFSYNSWLYICRHSSKPWPISRLRFQYIKVYFFFQILHKKSRKHLFSNMFCVFLHFLRSGLFRNSAISSSDSRERHFF